MNKFEELLNNSKITILDGAMGTMLMARGLKAGEAPESMNLNHPEIVKDVHRAYILAGSQIILTNSFGGNRFRLKFHGLETNVREINLSAARIAREVADEFDQLILVAGSIGPTGELMRPIGKLTYEEAVQAFAEQASALSNGGVDVIWIETMGDLNEVRAAVEGVRLVTRLPVTVTMTFESKGRTMMGVTPEQLVKFARENQLDAVGANCGKGPEELIDVIRKMRLADPEITLIAKANAGIPKLVNGAIVYDGTPDVMADYAVNAYRSGACLVGGCCGSSPQHIKAITDTLASVGGETSV
jgi:5-methyltetrahydrofolate--homocysteine methyltransferase